MSSPPAVTKLAEATNLADVVVVDSLLLTEDHAGGPWDSRCPTGYGTAQERRCPTGYGAAQELDWEQPVTPDSGIGQPR